MKSIAYYNGVMKPIDEMSIPMNDRAVVFGDGVYDVAYFRNGIPFAFDDNLDRFFSSCQKLRIPPPAERAALRETLLSIISRIDGKEGILYFQCSRGIAPRDHAFPSDGTPSTLLCYAKDVTGYQHGMPMKLITLPDLRYQYCDIKTINLLPNVLAYQQAKEKGCGEAVLHRDGRVTECAHSGLSIITCGMVVTPPLDNLILPSTSRKRLLELCGRLGIPSAERPFTLEEMLSAEEILVTNTLDFFSPVTQIDGAPVGGRNGTLYKQLFDAYIDWVVAETGE